MGEGQYVPLLMYRVAHWLHLRGVPVLPRLIKIATRLLFGQVLPLLAVLGQGVILGYQGLGTVIHRRARIGDRVNVGTCVTIGGRSGHQDVPVIGDDVMIGSGAKILGPVRIGKGASIGANAVVLIDVPDYGVAVGVPARVIKVQPPGSQPNYRDF